MILYDEMSDLFDPFFSCISHFDVLAQQRKQHEQQLKQSTAVGIESRVHSLASAPTDIRGTQTAVVAGTLSRQMEVL